MELHKLGISVLRKPIKAEEVKEEKKQQVPNEATKANVDAFVKSNESQKPVTYNKTSTLDELRSIEEKRLHAFSEMLSRMLAKQGEAYNVEFLGEKYNVSIEDSQKASLAIAEGGEYSVDAVVGRILDMAKSLSNGDKSKISVLRDAVEKGFGAAAKAFGRDMPSITKSTYDEVMKRFDEWEKEV